MTYLEGVIEKVTEALAEVREETVRVAQHFQAEDERVEAKFKLRQEVRCDVTAQLRQWHHCGVHVKLGKSGMMKITSNKYRTRSCNSRTDDVKSLT